MTATATPSQSTISARSALSAFIAIAVAHAAVDCVGGAFAMFKFLAGLDLALSGLVSTISLFLGAALQPVFGVWADHGHQRRFVLWGTALCGASFLFSPVGLAQNELSSFWTYGIIFALLLATRVGQAMFHPAGTSLVGAASGSRHTTWVSLFIAAGMLGFAGAQGLYAMVHHATDGRTHWALLPFAAFMVGLTLWCKPVGAAPKRSIDFRQIAAALHAIRGKLIGLFLIQLLNSAVANGFHFLVPEFTQELGYSTAMINGGASAAWVLGGGAMMVPLGLLADRMDRYRLLHWLSVLSVVFYFLMTLLPPMPTPIFIMTLALAGGVIGTINPLGVSMGQQLSPQHSSVISGVLMGLAWCLSSFTPWLIGKLVESGMTHAHALAAIGLLLIPACAFSLSLVRRQ